MSDNALGDLKVLDLAGPVGLYCTKLLAELGADTVKIEPPGGDPSRRIGPFINDVCDPEKSLFFFYYNSNKRSITLNLETEEGKAIFKRLVKTADILVESSEPGYLTTLGLGYEELSEIAPQLIMTSITGFGQFGPHSHYKWCDIVGVAMGGLLSLSGFPNEPPNYVGGTQGFNLAGVDGANGTLLALYSRDISGLGSHVDVSMQEAVITSTELSVPAYVASGAVRKRTGRQVYRGWNEIFPCKDGYVFCSPFGGGRWKEVLSWAEREGKAEDLISPQYAELLDIMAGVQMDRQTSATKDGQKVSLDGKDSEIAHVEAVWERFLMGHTKRDLYETCQGFGVALMPVYDAADQLDDPQLAARGWFRPVRHDELDRTLMYPGPPYQLSKTPSRITRRCPMIGEHNREIYEGELGFSPEELINLKRKGVI